MKKKRKGVGASSARTAARSEREEVVAILRERIAKMRDEPGVDFRTSF